MRKIWHGCKLTNDEFLKSKDPIFCVLDKGFNTSKLNYYIKDGNVLKCIINDTIYSDTIGLLIHKVSNEHKIRYILNNKYIEDLFELDIKELDEIFIKTYKEYE